MILIAKKMTALFYELIFKDLFDGSFFVFWNIKLQLKYIKTATQWPESFDVAFDWLFESNESTTYDSWRGTSLKMNPLFTQILNYAIA